MGFFSSIASFFGGVADVVTTPFQAIAEVASEIIGLIPGVPEEAVSFEALGETLFGGGDDPVAVSAISGRAPIPSPAEGGPPLVTGQVPDVPFQEQEIPILQELGIPFLDPFVTQFRPFEPGPAPFPDVGGFDMAVDATIFQAGVGGLPAILQRTTPIVGGVLGGVLQDIAGSFLTRAPQELGMAQVPARQPGALPMEKPSTRILRKIRNNTGVRMKLSSAKALIRQLGLQNGARCLGITVNEACTLIITASPRRRRGISGSDIRIVKRTARRFQSLQEDLSGLVSRRRAAPRRRPRHVHALAHTAPGG